jgi:hypothetical protein
LFVYCGSSIYNDIICFVGFFSCASHILVTTLSTCSSERFEKKKLKSAPILTSKCYYHHRHFELSKLKKRKPHSTFLPTLCLLLSHLTHSNEESNNKERWILKILHTDDKRGWPPTYLNNTIIVYLPSPCFLFIRISRRDSI